MFVVSVTGEVKSSQAFEGQDFALHDEGAGQLNGFLSLSAFFPVRLQPHAWSTNRAGDGLGMEAPVTRVVVFCRAIRA